MTRIKRNVQRDRTTRSVGEIIMSERTILGDVRYITRKNLGDKNDKRYIHLLSVGREENMPDVKSYL